MEKVFDLSSFWRFGNLVLEIGLENSGVHVNCGILGFKIKPFGCRNGWLFCLQFSNILNNTTYQYNGILGYWTL
jgi:hypothetical protein